MKDVSECTTKIHEMSNVTKVWPQTFFSSIFNTRNKLNYNLRHASYFHVPLVTSVYNGTKIISFLRRKIWYILPNEMKEMRKVEAFKSAIRKWKPGNCLC